MSFFLGLANKCLSAYPWKASCPDSHSHIRSLCAKFQLSWSETKVRDRGDRQTDTGTVAC